MALSQMILALQATVGNSTRKLILLKLADQANDDGVCWPAHSTIASASECSKSTVIRHLKKLETDGFVKTTKRKRDNGSDTSNVYQLTLAVGCQNETPPVSNCDSQNLSSEPKTKKDTKVSQKVDNLEQRANEFKREVWEIGKTKNYPIDMLKSFFDYWTEPTTHKTPKHRKDMERAWCTTRRLGTWYKRSDYKKIDAELGINLSADKTNEWGV